MRRLLQVTAAVLLMLALVVQSVGARGTCEDPTTCATPPSTPKVDSEKFIRDVTIVQDGTLLPAGTRQTKTWELLNDGTTTWSGYEITLTFFGGDLQAWHTANPPAQEPEVYSQKIPTVQPGQRTMISVTFNVPTKSGTYTPVYEMTRLVTVGKKVYQYRFGDPFWVQFVVK